MFSTRNIKKTREDLGYSQNDIAKLMNVSRTSYAMWETNNDLFPIKRLIDFCKICNISIDYALEMQNEKQSFNNDFDKNKLTKRLKEFRKNNNLTQDDLAKILNTTKAVISGYETGRYIIATPFLYTICQKYHISADYLLGIIDQEK